VKADNRRIRWIAMTAGSALCALAATSCQGTATASAADTASTASATASASASANASANASTLPKAAVASATSQASVASSASAASALSGKTVVIDPGHNGGDASHATEINQLVPMGFGQYKTCDTTGTNADDGYAEHEFNLQVADLVEAQLEKQGIKVIMTRTNDTGVGPCVNVRAAIGNDAHADAAISIHGDGFDASGHGFQIIQAAKSVGGTANDAQSNKLSEALHATFLTDSGLTPSTYIGTDGYETRSDLAGLNLSTVPKVLVECGNMKNPGDVALMESPTGRARIAAAIADGIISFLSQGAK
jgi:N-acetylmuramoyl-L-alanine amidase